MDSYTECSIAKNRNTHMHSVHLKKKKGATSPQLNRHLYELLLCNVPVVLVCAAGWVPDL